MEFAHLPPELVGLILGDLRTSYAMKQVSKAVGQCVVCAMHTMCLDGVEVHVKNLHLVLRDTNVQNPSVTGKLNWGTFRLLRARTTSNHILVSSDSTTSCLSRNILSDPTSLGLSELTLDVDPAMLRTLYGLRAQETRLQRLEIRAHRIPLELVLDSLRGLVVETLRLTGVVTSMAGLYLVLPRGLSALYVSVDAGEHDVHSLTSFLEHGLQCLHLVHCYETCASPYCTNHTRIADVVQGASRLPAQLALAPMPLAALTYAAERGVHVDVAECEFFDHEYDSVCALLV